MAFRDPSLEGPLERARVNPDNRQDILPETERGEDPVRNELEHGLARETSRPLSDEEKKAVDRDAPVGERVYAPASERVPVDPVPGHRDFVEHPDTHTPEREAADHTPTAEPTFTRVPRPRTGEPSETAPDDNQPSWQSDRRRKVFLGIGFSWFGVICFGIVAWLFLRWRSERNKPINRIRRQALRAASEIRERVPYPEDAARPAMGLTTALLSIALLIWKQTQARSSSSENRLGRHADTLRKHTDKATRRAEKVWGKVDKARDQANDSASDLDWQKRLWQLKERWTPGRVELEKLTISKHR